MKYLRTSWMAGMVCIALLAALALAGSQGAKQTERKGKVIEADKQTGRKGKVIEADKQTGRKGKVIEADKQTGRKGRVIEADAQTGRKGKVIEADRQGPRGAGALEGASKKGNQNELLSRVIEADEQGGPGAILRDYRQSKKEQPDRVRATPGQGPVISTNACPDPAARAIEFHILSRTTARSGRVRIEGVVRNIGREIYQSRPNLNSKVQLWQIGAGAPRLVAEKSFTSLLPELVNAPSSAAFASASVRAQFDRDWDSRSPNLGEFPPTYRLVIVYVGTGAGNGPGSSGQPDDCNLRNNVKERSGADINSMFRQ